MLSLARLKRPLPTTIFTTLYLPIICCTPFRCACKKPIQTNGGHLTMNRTHIYSLQTSTDTPAISLKNMVKNNQFRNRMGEKKLLSSYIPYWHVCITTSICSTCVTCKADGRKFTSRCHRSILPHNENTPTHPRTRPRSLSSSASMQLKKKERGLTSWRSREALRSCRTSC